MKLSSAEQRRVAAIAGRVKDLRESHAAEDFEKNRFVHMPLGTVAGELEFLLKLVKRGDAEPAAAEETEAAAV